MFEKIGPLCLSNGIPFNLSDLLRRYLDINFLTKPLVDQESQDTCFRKDLSLLALSDSCKRNFQHILD